jgi:hypothetical protein
MVLSMSRPQPQPKTGAYRARKAVPAEFRPIVGKRELIETLGTKDPADRSAGTRRCWSGSRPSWHQPAPA